MNMSNNPSIPLFDYAVSNPPYQDAGNSAVFHLFQTLADKIAYSTSFIYPADKWMTQSGKGAGFDEFSIQQVQSPFITKLSVYENTELIFPTIALHGGISIVNKNMNLWNDYSPFVESFEQDGYSSTMMVDTSYIKTLSTSNRMNRFVNKVMKDYSGKVLNDVLMSSAFYGIDSKYIERSDKWVRDVEYNGEKGFVKILTTGSSGKGGRVEWFWIPVEDVRKNHDTINSYKVAISPRHAAGYGGRSQHAYIYGPNMIFGDCRFCVRVFDNFEEADNFMKWMGTDVVRTLILSSSRRVKNFGVNVPLLPTFKNEDSEKVNGFDFAMTREELNEYLVKLYSLDEEDRIFMNYVISGLGSFESDN